MPGFLVIGVYLFDDLLFFHGFFLSSTKVWQKSQSSQYARGFGSAAVAPYTSGIPKILYSMGKSRDGMYSTVEIIGEGPGGLSQTDNTQAAISRILLFEHIS